MNKKSAIALTVAVLLCTMGAKGCSSADPEAVPECFASAAGPNDTTGGTGLQVAKAKGNLFPSVVGMVWTHCDPAPLSHILTVKIWYEPEGSVENFKMVSQKFFGGIPRPIPEPNILSSDPCLPGTYQLEFYAMGKTSQGELFTTDHLRGYTKTFTANDCELVH